MAAQAPAASSGAVDPAPSLSNIFADVQLRDPLTAEQSDAERAAPESPPPVDDGRRWSHVASTSGSPGSRVFPSACVHESSLYIFGGHDGQAYRSDLLVLDLEQRSWAHEGAERAPSPRDAHAAVIHAGCMYVFGGYDSKRYLNDFHQFDIAAGRWSALPASASAPSPRGGHTAVVRADQMLVFGGCDGWNYYNDTFRYCFSSATWSAVRVLGTAPGARSAPATVMHEAQGAMYIFGGYDGSRSLNDLFRFDMSRSEWAQVRMHGSPPTPRGGHTAAICGDVIYAFGGKSGRSPHADLCAFNLATSTWEHVQDGSLGGPAPRCAHVCAVCASSLYVFGGYDGRQYFDDCYSFPLTPPVPSSTVLSLAGERPRRAQPTCADHHCAVMSGDLEPMVDNSQFSDIEFDLGGTIVYAHKAARSPPDARPKAASRPRPRPNALRSSSSSLGATTSGACSRRDIARPPRRACPSRASRTRSSYSC